MSKDANGGPAFPGTVLDDRPVGHSTITGDPIYSNVPHPGMTLREYFAAQALAGLAMRMNAETFRRYLNGEADGREATVALRLADALLTEGEK